MLINLMSGSKHLKRHHPRLHFGILDVKQTVRERVNALLMSIWDDSFKMLSLEYRRGQPVPGKRSPLKNLLLNKEREKWAWQEKHASLQGRFVDRVIFC